MTALTAAPHAATPSGPAEWARVTGAVYRVRQHYRYTYSGPVTDVRQRLVMIPPDQHGDQRLVERRLEVRGASGACQVRWETDAFGNRVAHVYAGRVERAIDFEACYEVERRAHGWGGAREREGLYFGPAVDRRALNAYLEPTALTRPDARLRAVARGLSTAATSPRARAERAHDWAAGAIAYQFGVTGVQTPAAMALHLGKGVCQDYAHLMLCVLRLLGVPGRYVSGQLLGEGAPHAWVEALFANGAAPGGLEAVAYDPTHHRRVRMDYVTVAVGRDFADVTPTSGYFTGQAQGQLSASKHAEIVHLEQAGTETAAKPPDTGEGAA
jgi:transglutaminase-like putative cysteine protease